MTERFKDTGAKIGIENAPTLSSGLPVSKGAGAGQLAPCSVLKCELPQGGAITLGPARDAAESDSAAKSYWNWMYGVATKALEP